MGVAFFEVVDESDGTGRYGAGPATGGPRSDDLQHGGPPSALLVASAERVAAAGTGRADLTALRVAVEFVGPVPMADVVVSTRVVRAARTAALVEATLAAAGRDCLSDEYGLVGATLQTLVLSPRRPASHQSASSLSGR